MIHWITNSMKLLRDFTCMSYNVNLTYSQISHRKLLQEIAVVDGNIIVILLQRVIKFFGCSKIHFVILWCQKVNGHFLLYVKYSYLFFPVLNVYSMTYLSIFGVWPALKFIFLVEFKDTFLPGSRVAGVKSITSSHTGTNLGYYC